VLDLFAGSGSLGVEALSRGAAHVLFADTDPAARAAVAANLATVGAADRAEVRSAPAERVLAAAVASGSRFTLILLDPPYSGADWPGLLEGASAVLGPGGVIVAESDRPVPAGDLEVTRQKRYGGTVVTFARRPGAVS
jgi:16S rRNA (guanine966-N2)-methyltransferase